jgi:O-antigen/teichoic acid export membrane protein
VSLSVAHLAVTWFMVGVVWMIQIVHYPLFASIGSDGFVGYERGHTRRMGVLLLVPAVAEVVIALLLVMLQPDAIEIWAAWAAGAILAAIWIITLLVQVPIHRHLSDGYDERLVAALVRSNWVRTIAWSTRGVLAAAFLI